MKPYGLSRRDSGDVDCAGIRENGRKTSIGRLDARAMQRPASKAAARRRLARMARREGREAVRDY